MKRREKSTARATHTCKAGFLFKENKQTDKQTKTSTRHTDEQIPPMKSVVKNMCAKVNCEMAIK